jgi:hypothetical protein
MYCSPYAATAGEKQHPTILAEIIGIYRCAALGVEVHAPAPVLALCRALISAGHDRRRPLEAYRGDMMCLRVSSIGYGARWTVEDNRSGTPVLARWKEKASAGTGPASQIARTAAGALA